MTDTETVKSPIKKVEGFSEGLLTPSKGKNLLKVLAENVEDPRKKNGLRHPFIAVMLTIVLASLCGYTSPAQIANFAKWKFQFLNECLQEYKFRFRPSRFVFFRVLKDLDPERLGKVLDQWLKENYPELAIRDDDGHKQVAIDGKALLASVLKSLGDPTRYVLNYRVYGDSQGCLVLDISGKGNELTHTPEFIKKLDLNNALVTMDAMATHDSVIVALRPFKNCYWFFPFKANQKVLFEAMWNHRLKLMQQTDESGMRLYDTLPTAVIDRKKYHGRDEHIEVRVISGKENLAFLPQSEKAPILRESLKSIAIMEKTVTKRVKGRLVTTTSVRFFVTNIENLKPERVPEIRSRHWSVEMGHFLLDYVQNEDRQTCRTRNEPACTSVFRRFTQAIHARDPELSTCSLPSFIQANQLGVERLKDLLFLGEELSA